MGEGLVCGGGLGCNRDGERTRNKQRRKSGETWPRTEVWLCLWSVCARLTLTVCVLGNLRQELNSSSGVRLRRRGTRFSRHSLARHDQDPLTHPPLLKVRGHDWPDFPVTLIYLPIGRFTWAESVAAHAVQGLKVTEAACTSKNTKPQTLLLFLFSCFKGQITRFLPSTSFCNTQKKKEMHFTMPRKIYMEQLQKYKV